MWTISDRVRLLTLCYYLFHYRIIVNSIAHFLHIHDGFCLVAFLMFRSTLYWILLMLYLKVRNLSGLVSPNVQKSIILASLKKIYLSSISLHCQDICYLMNKLSRHSSVTICGIRHPPPGGSITDHGTWPWIPGIWGAPLPYQPPVTWYGQWLSVAKGPDTSLLQSHTTLLLLGQAATRLCQSPHHRFSWSGNTYPGVHGVPPKDVGLDCLELVYQHT